MMGWMQRVRVLAAGLTLVGGVNLLEAAPTPTDPGLRPCTELELCEAYGYGADDCASLNEPGDNYCPANVLMCGVSDLGHIYWIVSCTNYGTENCPTVMPCG